MPRLGIGGAMSEGRASKLPPRTFFGKALADDESRAAMPAATRPATAKAPKAARAAFQPTGPHWMCLCQSGSPPNKARFSSGVVDDATDMDVLEVPEPWPSLITRSTITPAVVISTSSWAGGPPSCALDRGAVVAPTRCHHYAMRPQRARASPTLATAAARAPPTAPHCERACVRTHTYVWGGRRRAPRRARSQGSRGRGGPITRLWKHQPT
mmetsp:Transcript_146349/g.469504  ORF Transcript_146349/g.469504 Transcript_146349/m.469504 type:complete len:212 (+) Transcript_146349:990-1625(+)